MRLIAPSWIIQTLTAVSLIMGISNFACGLALSEMGTNWIGNTIVPFAVFHLFSIAIFCIFPLSTSLARAHKPEPGNPEVMTLSWKSAALLFVPLVLSVPALFALSILGALIFSVAVALFLFGWSLRYIDQD